MYHLKQICCLLFAALPYIPITSAEYNETLEPYYVAVVNPLVGNEYAINDTVEITWKWIGPGNWTFGLIAGPEDSDLIGKICPTLPPTRVSFHKTRLTDYTFIEKGTNITVKRTEEVYQYNYTFPALQDGNGDYRTSRYLGVAWAFPNGTWNRNKTSQVFVSRNESTKDCTRFYGYDRANWTIVRSDDGECRNAAGKAGAANGLFTVVVAVAFSAFFL